jgi:hypothetical protein
MSKLAKILIFLIFLTTPLESYELFAGTSIVKLVSIGLIIAVLFTKKNFLAVKDPFILLMFIYACYSVLSIIWSIDTEVTAIKTLTTLVPNILVAIIIFNFIDDRKDLESIFLAWVIGSLIIAVIAFNVFKTGSLPAEDDEDRVTALGQDQNELSFLLSFGIISIIYLVKYAKLRNIQKIALIGSGFFLVFMILTTGSRTGFLILLMIGGLLTLMNYKKAGGVLLIPLIFIIGIMLFQLLPDTTADRILQVGNQIKSKDLTGRVFIWRLGYMAFETKDSYILGTGYYSFHSLLAAKTGWAPAIHNTYLSNYIELGALGLLIYASMVIYLLSRTLFLVRNCSVFFVLLILPLLTAMFVLGTDNRRWLFIIGVIIVKLRYFAGKEIDEARAQRRKSIIPTV